MTLELEMREEQLERVLGIKLDMEWLEVFQ